MIGRLAAGLLEQTDDMVLLTGSAHHALASRVARHLGTPLAACVLERFPDGELHVELKQSVRGQHVCLVQPTTAPVEQHLFELLLLSDACRRAGARRRTAAVRALLAAGCRPDLTVVATHLVFAEPAAAVLGDLPVGRLITTDSVAPTSDLPLPVEIVPIASLVADAIMRLDRNESLSGLAGT